MTENITATEIREREKALPPMKQPIIEELVDRELKAIEKIQERPADGKVLMPGIDERMDDHGQ